jgi:hypothetical protein
MGHGLDSELEQLSKALPVNADGCSVDLGLFKQLTQVCVNRLLKLVDDEKKKTAFETAPSSLAHSEAS